MANHFGRIGKGALVACSMVLPLAAHSGTAVNDFVEINETTGVGTSLELNNGTNTPDKDWSIFNDGSNGLLSFGFFSSENVLQSIPFILENGAPTASLRIKSDGKVGLGTNTPGGPLGSRLTVSAAQPSIFFDQTGGSANWTMGADPTWGTFFANNSDIFMSIMPTGNVGVSAGFAPAAKLHVGGVDDAKVLAKNTGNGIGTKIMFNLENGGGIRFDMLDRSTGNNWVFQNQFGTFDVTLAGTGTREFRFYPNGNLEIAGTLIAASSRDIKNNISPVDQQSVLERVVALPINSWSYKKEQGVTHIGPMAEDFFQSFGLGNTDKGISPVDTGGVALAAIQGLKQEKDQEVEVLRARLQQQDERMRQLESALAELRKNGAESMTVSASGAAACTMSPAVSL